MATATSHVALRDDAGGRSLSTNERSFLRSCATSAATGGGPSVRADGRHPTEARPLRLTLSRSHGTAECVARLGAGTRVAASVGCDLIPPPNRDRPNDGQVRFGVDLSPMASAAFGAGGAVYSAAAPGGGGGRGGGGGGGGAPPDEAERLLSNRILRTLERTLLAGGAIDSEALCVQSGRWVWRLSVDVACLDHGGNLADASVVAAVAALRHFRKPEVIVSDGGGGGEGAGAGPGGPVVLSSDEREPAPLPLHHTPLSVTFALFSDREGSAPGAAGTVAALVDPTDREEMVADGTATLSYNRHGELCGMDYPGGTELRPAQLVQCARLGEKRCGEWCNFLEGALSEADAKAAGERMDRLKAAASVATAGGAGRGGPTFLPDVADGTPFAVQTDPERDGHVMEVDRGGVEDLAADQARAAAEVAAAEEEERYRLRALDYALGHVAVKVKEDGDKGGGSGRGGRQGTAAGRPSSLMDSMLKSVSSKRSSADAQMDQTGDVVETKSTSEPLLEKAPPATTVDGRSPEEARARAKPPAPKKGAEIDSDEEEEVTTTLQSEFANLTSKAAPAAAVVKEKEGSAQGKSQRSPKQQDDGDVDDLAMAIKKKPKKKKKSKK